MNLALDDLFPSMPWERLDAVVFDVGNVLLSFDPAAILERLFPGDAALQAALNLKVFRSPYWAALDHGAMTQEEAIAAMTGRDASLAPAIRRLMENWIALKPVVHEGVAALRACKSHGKKTYVLSNYHDSAFAYVEAHHDFFRLFDGFIVSARVGLCKPDPAIYRTLTDRFGLAPARTLFIDDTPANVEAALALGWQGFCLNCPGKLERFIQAG